MRINLKLKENPFNFMRRCGYHYERTDEKTGQLIFARTLGVRDYPRFHAYVQFNQLSQETVINLHLDQKRPVYKGTSAHAAEYSGPVVEGEVERIKEIVAGR